MNGMMGPQMPPMGMPPMGPPMGAPMGPPPMAGPGGGTEDAILLQLLQAAMGKWGGEEAQLAGEKSTLMGTLMGILGVQPPTPVDAFAEAPESMVGPLEDDIPSAY